MKRSKIKILKCGVALLILLSLLAGVIPLQASAAELAGYTAGAVVRIKNVGSGKYLNVGLGVDANGTNVYQYSIDGSTEQKFKLRYIVAADAYVIGTMCSSDGNNRVLDIKRSGNALASGMNVQIYTVSDTTAQQFKFTHYGQGKYVITPKANTSLFLTANGNSNGSSSGKSSTSAGNVYISSMLGEEDGLPVASNYQLWTIETVQNEMTLASGCYRIRNKNSGKYMTATANNTVSQKNRDEATIWEIVYTQVGTDGYYCIYIANGNDMGITSNLSYSSALIYPSIANISYIINTDYMMFIIKNADDTDSYRIASRDGYNSTTMTVFTGSTAEDAQVCETGYTGNNSQRWIFESVDESSNVMMISYFLDSNYCVNDDNNISTQTPSELNRSAIFKDCAAHAYNVLDNVASEYALSLDCCDNIENYDDFFYQIKGHDFVLINNHGQPKGDVPIESVEVGQYISIDLERYDHSLYDNKSLLGTDLMIWLACKAGYGGVTGNNFAKLSYEKGAEVVLAWKHSIQTSDVKEWMDCFYYITIEERSTLNDLIALYDADFYDTTMDSDKLTVFGDLNRTLEEILQ